MIDKDRGILPDAGEERPPFDTRCFTDECCCEWPRAVRQTHGAP